MGQPHLINKASAQLHSAISLLIKIGVISYL
jgi:hypothetical protein